MTNRKNNTKKNNNGTARKAATRGVSKSKRGSYRKSSTQRRQQLLSQAARKAFDAFHPSHLPLPVPTAPYLTVRSRVVITTNKTLTVVGPVEDVLGNSEAWSNVCAFGFNHDTVLGSTGTVQYYTFNPPASDAATDWEVTPAAYSFQVACTDSLTSASGVTYIGRLKTTLSQPTGDDTRTAQNLADAIVQYSNPKCLSNAKLAMNAQQVNLMPGNMSELTDFREMNIHANNPSTMWGSNSNQAARNFAGFKPGYIYNPYNKELVVTIAMEWRVRLAPNNPMHQSMTHYPPTHPNVWHALAKAADSTAHGVEDVGALGAAGYLASSAAGEGGLMGAFDSAMGAVGGLLPEIGSAAASAAEFAPLLLL